MASASVKTMLSVDVAIFAKPVITVSRIVDLAVVLLLLFVKMKQVKFLYFFLFFLIAK